mgnify:CR=1 FL=1
MLIMFICHVFEVKVLELGLRNAFGRLEFVRFSDYTNRAQNRTYEAHSRMCGMHNCTYEKQSKQVEHSEIKNTCGAGRPYVQET